jgi:hypothetical protein
MGLVAVFTLLKKGSDDAKEGTDSFASSLFKGVQALGDIIKSL